MHIYRVDSAIENVLKLDVEDLQIENLLTCSLLVLICGEFEKMYRNIIVDRCCSTSDTSIQTYLESCTQRLPRSLMIDEIAGLAGRFGTIHKKRFRTRLKDNSEAKEMYESIVSNRHLAAHGGVVQTTFGDVKTNYEKGHVVLDFFKESL